MTVPGTSTEQRRDEILCTNQKHLDDENLAFWSPHHIRRTYNEMERRSIFREVVGHFEDPDHYQMQVQQGRILQKSDISEAVHRRTRRSVIIKKLAKTYQKGINEAHHLRVIAEKQDEGVPDSDLIVRLLGGIREQHYDALVLEPLGLSLEGVLRGFRGCCLNQEACKMILRDTLKGLAFLHDVVGIVHRDIKPSNICMTQYNAFQAPEEEWTVHVKIIDLDSATSQTNNINGRITCGTRGYEPPEMLLMLDYDTKVDIWGAGLVAMNVSLGWLGCPFNQHSGINALHEMAAVTKEQFQQHYLKAHYDIATAYPRVEKMVRREIRDDGWNVYSLRSREEGTSVMDEDILEDLESDWRNFIKGMLRLMGSDRPSASELLEDPVMT